MNKLIEKLKAFNEAFGIPYATEPTNCDVQTTELRHRLMQEENDEYLEGAVNEDLTEVLDGLADQMFILCGTILKHGLQDVFEEAFYEVYRSNMSKLDESGKPIHRDDGKILKGPNYFRPDLKKILDNK